VARLKSLNFIVEQLLRVIISS